MFYLAPQSTLPIKQSSKAEWMRFLSMVMLSQKTFPKVIENCPNHNHGNSLSFPCAIYSEKVAFYNNKWGKIKSYFPISLLLLPWESGIFGKQESWIAPSYIWESFNGTILIQSCFWYLGNQTYNLCLCRGSKHSHTFSPMLSAYFCPKTQWLF